MVDKKQPPKEPVKDKNTRDEEGSPSFAEKIKKDHGYRPYKDKNDSPAKSQPRR